MGSAHIHRILAEVGSNAFPGVFDSLSAKLAHRAGFPMAFVSGYSVAATAVGEPDLGLLTQTEMIDRARRICLSVPIPIIFDADTGYGNPLNVHRTVVELIAAVAAGCFLEDQVWPKRCGHMRGKRVIGRDDYVQKVRAAVEARGGRDFFIVARTDALAVDGLDEAIARVEAARAAGAYASSVEAPGSREDLSDRPPLAGAQRGQHDRRGPDARPAEGRDGGPRLPSDPVPLTGLFAAARAIEARYRRLRADGTTLGDEGRLMSFAEFNYLIGVDERYALAERFGVGFGEP
jgi:2-methylisocitrate lyase-like PEP mutase family enzyme